MTSIRLAIQSAAATDQPAQIIFHAPLASWSWQKQVIPFSDQTFQIIVELVITTIFYFRLLFTASLHHEAGNKAKRSPWEDRGHVTITLTWRKIVSSTMKGLSFSPPPGNSTGWGQERDEVSQTGTAFTRASSGSHGAHTGRIPTRFPSFPSS